MATQVRLTDASHPVLAAPTGNESVYVDSAAEGVQQLLLNTLASWLAGGGLIFTDTTNGHTYKLALTNGILESIQVS